MYIPTQMEKFDGLEQKSVGVVIRPALFRPSCRAHHLLWSLLADHDGHPSHSSMSDLKLPHLSHTHVSCETLGSKSTMEVDVWPHYWKAMRPTSGVTRLRYNLTRQP